ncbi:hypothetical protein [Bacillus altitudinis]|nr:hypothetical protein [Bacillus altitudinis]MEC3813310.1 hypothetical protein [Bacillus altitudinis]
MNEIISDIAMYGSFVGSIAAVIIGGMYWSIVKEERGSSND